MILFLEQVECITLACFRNLNTFSKKKKMPRYIIKDIEISSDESDKEDSDEENYVKKILMRKNHIKSKINSIVFKRLF